MIPLPFLAGKTVAVLGLGRTGRASVAALTAAGATVLAWDDQPAQRGDVPVVDLLTVDFSTVDLLLQSPGIPHTHPAPHPVTARARAHGVPVIGDTELLFRAQAGAQFIGITGTNGKSTTTSLIAHLFEAATLPVAVGGNLGPAVLGLPVTERYVLEMSSYQLELTPSQRFDIAILLNISPDHLARHGGMEGYVAAKRQIFSNWDQSCTAVIGIDDPQTTRIAGTLAFGSGRVVTISGSRAADVWVDGTMLIDALDDHPVPVLDLSGIATLPGRHNAQNAAAAYAALRIASVDRQTILDGLVRFPGLAHRQQLVATVDGVRFINDSKATNADAAAVALVCYERIHWIAGGQAKEGGIESLRPLFDRIAGAYLIGEAAAQFAETLGAVPHEVCGTLAVATARAFAAARRDGGVVLLSPAAASWDQFRSFEHRGDSFTALVADLAAGEAA
ncbi:MAG: UDP-N-acetylmuramoyl-L-alanine--D-glutamate ligase [Alphaproteobacteria bacterium]|nr:MAG: UDP-N-acetylmuramoyl-L-alanine--D-glutamate ligase [Alphaproteobacteria bacterium]